MSEPVLASSNKRPWIGTSWKMNKTLAQAREFCEVLRDAESSVQTQRFIVPPYTALREVKALLADTDILVGAQNMHWQDAGAWTGEISPAMLVDCHMDLVELGHSERRAHFAETDLYVSLKVEAALNHHLIPLVCIGETADERDSGLASKVLQKQVRGALDRVLEHPGRHQILFAYEPVWAIGAHGQPATAAYAEQRHAHIVGMASELVGSHIPCLYGGSVNPDNCAELISSEHVDGLFIGRSAWDVHGYIDILRRCDTAIR